MANLLILLNPDPTTECNLDKCRERMCEKKLTVYFYQYKMINYSKN